VVTPNLYYPYGIPLQQRPISYALSPASLPLRFWPSFCLASRRDMAALWQAFDTDANGLITLNEVAAAAMCNPTGGDALVRKAPLSPQVSQYIGDLSENCKWLSGDIDSKQPLGRYLTWYGEYDGHGDYAGLLLASKLLDLFQGADINNDNCLDMNEFWTFGSHLWDGAHFFLISTRTLDEDGIPEIEGESKISQTEWDCAQNADEDGHDLDNCNPSESQQLLLSAMPGNNLDGDSETLNLPEFKSIWNTMLLKAKASPFFDGYCKNWAASGLPFMGEEVSQLDLIDKKFKK